MGTKIKEDVYQEEHERVDPETGEICTDIYRTSKQTRIYNSQDEFIQIYLHDMSGLMNITSKTELQILMQLWKISSFNGDDNSGNFIIINQKIISDLAKAVNVKEQTVKNSISSLIKNNKKPLIKDPKFRATYYLNPIYFFKGALKDRPKVMKVILKYVDSNQIQPNEDFNVKED